LVVPGGEGGGITDEAEEILEGLKPLILNLVLSQAQQQLLTFLIDGRFDLEPTREHVVGELCELLVDVQSQPLLH